MKADDALRLPVHDVRRETVGEPPRTSYTCLVCSDQIARRSSMFDEEWATKRDAFFARHSTSRPQVASSSHD